MTDVQVKIELGHKALPRAKPNPNGFTHDWTVYVRGPDQTDIAHFVEKVVFNLHASFENPERVCKEPPYQVSEQGYAGFEFPIDIYFKDKAEPKKLRFTYNLDLKLEEPVTHSRCEKVTFQNPTDEFKKNLLKAGGVYIQQSKMATKWACLGPGKISEDFFHAIEENLPSNEHEFISVASRDQSKAQKFADRFKFKKAYGSYDDVANDKEVEVVYIGTLHTTHAELSIKMLEAGKHVLCEKPMGLNLKQAKAVLDCAKKNNKYFMEAIWSRFFPVYQQIQKEKASLGDIRLVTADFSVPIADVPRLKSPELGGGGLMDIGIYLVQFACFVFDNEMPDEINVIGNLTDTGVDECGVIVLKYKNGAIANLTYHMAAGVGKNVACIQGKTGRFDVGSPFWCPTTVTTPTGKHDFPLTGDYNYDNSGGLNYEAAATRQCILKGELENSTVSHKDSEVIHTILEKIRKQLGVKYPQDD